MRDVWGLIVALTGLFIVWLWATGKAESVWKVLTDNSGNKFNPASVNLNPPNVINGEYQPNTNTSSIIQVTPFELLPINPTYIPSVGSLLNGQPTQYAPLTGTSP